MTETIKTTSDDVLCQLCRGKTAEKEYSRWNNGRERQVAGVISTVMNHKARALYLLTPEAVDRTFRESKHPLGSIDKEEVEKVIDAKDWHPTYAFTHLLHFLLEADGELPTWQRFHNFFTQEARGKQMLGKEAAATLARITKSGVDGELAHDAMIWRIGNAYYGIMRDIYTLTHLRALGADARAHPLADALFRTDMWIGNTVLSIRVRNPEYADGADGRKHPAEYYLGDADPKFEFRVLELEAATVYGVIHLPSVESIHTKADGLHLT